MREALLRLLICAGGTGGGVYPALAVLDGLADLGYLLDGPELEVLWVGSQGGMEENLVNRAKLPYESIPAAGVHGVGLRALPGNLLRLGRGVLASRKILHRFRPQVLLFTGGYVAVPLGVAARLPGSARPRPRILLYVPDIEPGLALKTLARFADRIAVTSSESKKYFSTGKKVVTTGYPVRRGLRSWDKDDALKSLGLHSDLPVLLVFGGSSGARSINKALQGVLVEVLAFTQVIHLTGRLDWAEVKKFSANLQLSSELRGRYHPFPYLHERMGAALTVADLALTRAGASVLGELPAFGLPAILVPYPHAWLYQQVNARMLASRKAAIVIQDSDLPIELLPKLRALLEDQAGLARMRTAMLSLAKPEAAREIAGMILEMHTQKGSDS